MTPRSKIIVTLCLLVFLGALGAADYFVSNDVYQANLTGSTASTNSSVTSQAVATEVAKSTGPNVASVAQTVGFTTEKSNDLTFLEQVTAQHKTIESLTLLKDNDRAGSVTYVDSPDVKKYFVALKEALVGSFSVQVKDLKDTTEESPDQPTRNVLTFIDPVLSPERMVFVRVRERLYEFHVIVGKEDAVQPLIDALTH